MNKYKVLKPISSLYNIASRIWVRFVLAPLYKSRLGYCGKDVTLRFHNNIRTLSHIYMYDDTYISEGFTFISFTGNLIMKEHSGASDNFTVVTNNHGRIVGRFIKDTEKERSHEQDADVVIDEDVEIGTSVTLMAGVHVGRGAAIGSGSVVRNNIPPYAIAIGNPAKVVGFTFTPEQIIEHERVLYPESKRLPIERIEKNYKKYFLDRMKEIRSFTSL